MNNVEALKALFAALGGEPADVANATTSVEVLNAIAAMFEGESDAVLNPEAIENIAAVADNIGGGSPPAFKAIISYDDPAVDWKDANAAFYNPTEPGIFNVTFDYTSKAEGSPTVGNKIYLGDVLIKANIRDNVPAGNIFFTPATEFDGFYAENSKIPTTGDTITPGDGFVYKANITTKPTASATITKYSAKVVDF